MNLFFTKRFLLFTIFLLNFHFSLFAQIKFEEGYLIKNSGIKVPCLIRNTDWKNTPAQFSYKLTENGQIYKSEIDSIKEFGIGNQIKFRRFEVLIDDNHGDINSVSTRRVPDFAKKTIYLQVLIEGNASLYLYENNSPFYFFSTSRQLQPAQLVHRTYLTLDNQLSENNTYKHQLWENLNCDDLPESYFEELTYIQSTLTQAFIKYNKCSNSTYIQYQQDRDKYLVHFYLRPGANLSSFKTGGPDIFNRNINFDKKTTFRLGAELEVSLPFNKNKWSIFLEPTYQHYKAEKERASIDYNSIEIPIGLRHSFFFSDQARLFLNVAYIVDMDLNSKVILNPYEQLDIRPRKNMLVGIGYHFKRYLLEMRYQLPRQLLGDYLRYNSKYQTLSIIFGIKIF